MGSGGLGAYYGALLAKTGSDVTFIARGAHLDALRADGLTIKSVHGDFVVKPAHRTDDPRQVGTVDLILFAVKTYQTEDAARALAPMVGPDTMVLTFQNGVENHTQIDAAIGAGHTLVAPTQIASTLAAPGVVVQTSPFRNTVIGEVRGGLTPRVEKLVALFMPTGIHVSAAANGLTPLWHKFIFLASFSGLTTLARTEAATLLQMPEARATLRAAMQEIYAVGRAHAVPMDDDIAERHYQFCLAMKPGLKSSMHVDLERGRRLEIDALSGAVVRLGAAKNVPTPVHQTIYVALKMADENRSRL
jgi:2-dehydropantoate 2-reductase